MKEFKAQRQQGVAIITVMLVAALVTVIVTQIGSTTYMSRRIMTNMLQSDQAFYYAYGAEELALGLIKLSLEKEGGDKKVHLGQTWANPAGFNFPIEEGEKGNLEAVGYVRGVAKDKRACFNLNAILLHTKRPPTSTPGNQQNQSPNLTVDDDISFANTPSLAEEVFVKLLSLAGVTELEVQPNDLAAALRDWIDADTTPSAPGGAEDSEYLGLEKPYRAANSYLGSVSELLVIKGFNKKVFDLLRPLVCAVPVDNLRYLKKPEFISINVNTLTPEQAVVLASVYGADMTVEIARQLIDERPEDGYDESAYKSALSSKMGGSQAQLCTCAEIMFKSDLFEINIDTGYMRGRAKLNTLVKKEGSAFKVVSRYFGEAI